MRRKRTIAAWCRSVLALLLLSQARPDAFATLQSCPSQRSVPPPTLALLQLLVTLGISFYSVNQKLPGSRKSKEIKSRKRERQTEREHETAFDSLGLNIFDPKLATTEMSLEGRMDVYTMGPLYQWFSTKCNFAPQELFGCLEMFLVVAFVGQGDLVGRVQGCC